MKVLSIKQPWAALIVHGIKDIENRTWRTNHRGITLIHASKKFNQIIVDKYVQKYPEIAETVKITGAIIGAVDIIACRNISRSEWFTGPYGFVLHQPILFYNTVEVKGKLKFWEFDIKSYSDFLYLFSQTTTPKLM
ncbi:ASCH domain-containing protein [Candidatus Pacearchaeota archaeon]|nr:ASCH domain-containing protein [Candidatus Pacearchaeota archaeon]